MENNINNPGRDDSSSYSFQSGPSLSLTTELQQGKELARQLQMLLLSDQPPHSAAFRHHDNSREVLVQQIIASFDRAASIAQLNEPLAAPSPPPPSLTGAARSDSPLSGGANSPRSEDSDPINGDPDSRRRRHKVQPRWTTKVQVSAETGFEEPPGDGYNWRKYGQKDILGANYPRAYYRCALKQQTNCPATKQVQRTDEDPSLFEVTYRALHTCNHPGANPTNYQSSSSSHPNQPQRSTETLISFTPPNNASFIVPQNTNFHHQQHLPANPNRGFHFQASSSAPTTTASATINQATSSVSATSSPINITHDFPFDQFDFDASEFFH